MKKTKIPKWVKVRPFDRWKVQDISYLSDLDPQEKEYMIRYIMEGINGYIDKSSKSVFSNANAKIQKLREIKADPEQLKKFKERKKAYEKDNKTKITDGAFLKIEWQRQSNREVAGRRNDAYSRLLNSHEGQEVPNEMVRDTSLEQIIHQQNYENDLEMYFSNKVEHEDVDLFKKCLKADRVDYYIYVKLIEICGAERLKNPNFNYMLEDLKGKNEEYENKVFKKHNYYLFLYSCFLVARQFCKDPESKITVNELTKIFSMVVYPKTKSNKLKGNI